MAEMKIKPGTIIGERVGLGGKTCATSAPSCTTSGKARAAAEQLTSTALPHAGQT
jgi:hypothetical protein